MVAVMRSPLVVVSVPRAGCGGAAGCRGDLLVGEIADITERHRGPLLGGQSRDGLPDFGVGGVGVEDRLLAHRLDRHRRPSPGPVVVDRLAVGDRHQPSPQVAGIAQARVGTQRGHEGLLEGVLGPLAADGPAQYRHHFGGVLVDQRLEWREVCHRSFNVPSLADVRFAPSSSLGWPRVTANTENEMRELVARALAEDLGAGDVTGEATVPAERMASARIVQKAPGVVFGLDLVVETMSQTGVEEVETV